MDKFIDNGFWIPDIDKLTNPHLKIYDHPDEGKISLFYVWGNKRNSLDICEAIFLDSGEKIPIDSYGLQIEEEHLEKRNIKDGFFELFGKIWVSASTGMREVKLTGIAEIVED